VVRVKLYGAVRRLADQAEVELSVESGATLNGVLRLVCRDPGALPSRLVSTILVNGRNCAFSQGLDTPVLDGDLIELLPIVSGG
jgi:molybdopterin converting factor small subunit